MAIKYQYLIFFAFFCTIPLLIWSQFSGKRELNSYDAQALQKKVIRFEYFDREHSSVIYDTLPYLIYSQNHGNLALQPFIKQNTITGDVDFQMWVIYFPPFDTTGWVSELNIDYLSFTTGRQRLTLPLLFQTFNPPSFGEAIPGKASDAEEIAYAYLYPEDIDQFTSIYYETQETPVEIWEPYSIQKRLEELEKTKLEYITSENRWAEINAYRAYQDKRSAETGRSFNKVLKPLEFKKTDHVKPGAIAQRLVTITLHGSEFDVSWDVLQEDLWKVYEMIELYRAMSNRTLPSP
ncbi:hypothetical protein SAMN02745150_01390 [Brevinema andersonii]|uniref:Uncharacterized protein n=1 Tax=Brevinema andersonii TaxID=34097 RepID=A0A1I1F8K9_BREAD|nr:hypothetical protein [Brevinema andersonii]SFB94038.1 hypothetical protein SAMN02745150_01390 [Brevinema andersonii]